MPFINIAIAGTPLSNTQKQQLFDETTRLMSGVLGKNPDLTSVRIDEYTTSNWAIAGRAMSVRGETAVHMDIKVTKDTNTNEEKAQMIAQGMKMLSDIVGNQAKASYIVIHDLPAASWGYDGQTQLARTKL